MLVSEGINKIMDYKRKYKWMVVNIGVKMFARNREDKCRAKVFSSIIKYFILVPTNVRWVVINITIFK